MQDLKATQGILNWSQGEQEMVASVDAITPFSCFIMFIFIKNNESGVAKLFELIKILLISRSLLPRVLSCHLLLKTNSYSLFLFMPT